MNFKGMLALNFLEKSWLKIDDSASSIARFANIEKCDVFYLHLKLYQIENMIPAL